MCVRTADLVLFKLYAISQVKEWENMVSELQNDLEKKLKPRIENLKTQLEENATCTNVLHEKQANAVSTMDLLGDVQTISSILLVVVIITSNLCSARIETRDKCFDGRSKEHEKESF